MKEIKGKTDAKRIKKNQGENLDSVGVLRGGGDKMREQSERKLKKKKA